MNNLKSTLLSNAMKVMQSDTARKVMESEKFQQAMAFAFRTTFKVKSGLDNSKKKVASTLNLVTKEEVRDLRRSVERLERRLRKAEKKTKKSKKSDG